MLTLLLASISDDICHTKEIEAALRIGCLCSNGRELEV